MNKAKQAGFTLIELIIVIVILGILAVTASPKFLDLQGDAKASTVEGLSASLKGAANIVYSKALIQGVAESAGQATTNPAVNVEFGYPEATIATMQAILDASIIDGNNSATAQDADWEAEVDGTTIRIYPEGDYSHSNDANDSACYVEYTEATDADTPATVEIFTTEC